MSIKRYQHKIGGSGITGDEFQFVDVVLATDHEAALAACVRALTKAMHRIELLDRGSTHYEGCKASHPVCALLDEMSAALALVGK